MKKVRLFLAVLTVIASFNFMATNTYCATTIQNDHIQVMNVGIVLPNVRLEKKVSIEKRYSSQEDIPSSVYYHYYDEKLEGWYGGTLKLKSTKKKGKKYIATFSGTVCCLI